MTEEEYLAGEYGDPNLMWADNCHDVVENISSKKIAFFCDSTCIVCTMCSNIAPSNFKLSENGDHDICFKQPENQEELDECYEALENCPVGAIGHNAFDRGEEMVKAFPIGHRFAPTKYDGNGKLIDPSMKSSGAREYLGSTNKTLFSRIKGWVM